MTEAFNPGLKAAGWWSSVTGSQAQGYQRADRAKLRRLRTFVSPLEGRVFPSEAVWELRSFWDLRKALDGVRVSNENLAVIASLLVHVSNDGRGNHPALALLKSDVSESRFKRLVAADCLVALHAPLTQALAQVKPRTAPSVVILSSDLLCWQPQTRRRWSEMFWDSLHSAQPAPGAVIDGDGEITSPIALKPKNSVPAKTPDLFN